MKYAKIIITVSILWFVLIAGCATQRAEAPPPPPTPAPSATYNNGVLQTVYPVPFDQVWDSTLTTLNQLGMPVVKQDKVVNASIDATGKDGSPVRIQMNPKGLGATVVSIQVGSGNEQASRAINSALANNLGVKIY